MRAFFIPHSYSGRDSTPFHPFCSQGQNEENVANAFCTNHSNSRIVNKKTRSKSGPLTGCGGTELHPTVKSAFCEHLCIILRNYLKNYGVKIILNKIIKTP